MKIKTSEVDALRLQVLQEVMELDEDRLRELHEAMDLVSGKKNQTLYDLLHTSADELNEGKSITYTTEEVMGDIDEEMGWK